MECSNILVKTKKKAGFSSVEQNIWETHLYLKHFLHNNLISFNQSGFKTGDSCINQLIVTTHDTFKGFDNGLELRHFSWYI